MGCLGCKQEVPSRYIWMEYAGENNEKKEDKWEIKTKGELGSKKGDLFHAKLGGLNATAVMLSFCGTRSEVCKKL